MIGLHFNDLRCLGSITEVVAELVTNQDDVIAEIAKKHTTTESLADEDRAAGATACRTILIALDAKPGEPLVPPTAPAVSDSPIAAVVAGLRGVPVDQLLDLAIAKLRTLVPADVTPIAPRMSIPMIQVPRR